MDRELERHHVAHEFLSIARAGHELSGASKADKEHVHERVMTFLRSHSG